MSDEDDSRLASKRGRKSIRKGKAYERWVANELKELWPGARRGIGQARAAGEVPDVDGTPYWIEAKNHKRVSIRKAYEQGLEARIERDFNNPLEVLVVSRDFGQPDLVTMSLVEFKRLMHVLMPTTSEDE